jgi:hypothetical protein
MTMPDGTPIRATHSGEAKPAEPASVSTMASGLAALPPPSTTRWVIRRKAAVVSAVRSGLLTLEDACQRYTLSVEEFLSWQRLIERHGVRGLRATRLQDYRPNGLPEAR